jgi:cobalt-zinc-cadmium efflux system outer membrane protein
MFGFLVTAFALAALLIGGCASQPADKGFADVQKLVGERTAHAVRWNQHSPADAAVSDELRKVLQKPLGVEEAVQVALLNNHSLQATFEEIGVAQADLVQAGLLSNPKFFASLRFPNQGPGSPDAEFSVAGDFLELFLVPLRKQMAADRLAAAQRRVADAVLDLEHRVRVAFYTYQARRQEIMVQQTMLDAQATSLELARRQNQAGNMNDLDLASEEATYSTERLEVARTETQIRGDREELNRLLGLWGQESASWRAAEKLPELPATEPPMQNLESAAIRQRLDLDASRREAQAIAQSLGLTEQFRLTGIELGIGVERRDPTEHYVTVAGPQLSVELPIFDQKQAQVARLQAEYRQSLNRLTALAIDVRSQVRAARDRVQAARATAAFYRDVLIPQRREVARLSGLHYNVMLLGVDRWLMARQAEVAAYKEYVEAARDYWIAKADLERAVGGRMEE